MNARETRWFDKPGQGYSLPLTGVRAPLRWLATVPEDGPWGFYCADETAARYNASSPEDTQDGAIAYARFPSPEPTRYRDGLLPD